MADDSWPILPSAEIMRKTLKKRKVASPKPNLIQRKAKPKNVGSNMDTDVSDTDYNSANEFESLKEQIKLSDASKIIAELKRKSAVPFEVMQGGAPTTSTLTTTATKAATATGTSLTTAATTATHTQVTSSPQQISSNKNVETTSANANVHLSSDVPTIHASKVKIPPINVVNQNPGDMVRLIRALGVSKFYIKSLPGKKHAILINEIEPYEEVKKCLTEANVKFFTYTPKHLKNQTFVLKGLHQSENVDDILQCLKRCSSNELDVIKVTRFTTRRSTANKAVLPIFLVHISASSQSKHLVKIRRVNYQVVQWERLRKGGILQCKNCQRFGHAAANCNMGYRCVKCDKSHEPGKCSIIESNVDKTKIFCVTCNAFGHPASYRGCPGHKKLIVRMREKVQMQSEQKQLKQRMVNNYVKPQVSFANLFQSQPSNSRSQQGTVPPALPQPNNFEQALSLLRDSILSSMNKQFDIFYKMLSEQNERIDALYDTYGCEAVNYG